MGSYLVKIMESISKLTKIFVFIKIRYQNITIIQGKHKTHIKAFGPSIEIERVNGYHQWLKVFAGSKTIW